jgi:anti-sigma factor (TIGR02949 family)
MISCAEAVRQLWEFIDESVGEEQRQAIEEHLAFCRRCCGEVEFAQELQRFLRDHAEDDLPDEVHARLVATIHKLTDGRGEMEARP